MSRSLRGICLVLGLLFLPAAVRAEAERITFPDAVRIALERNSALLRSENDEALNRTAVADARMQFFPDLRLGASAGENFGRTFSESEGRILSQTNQSFSANLSSSVLLFNGFGRRANLRAALLSLESAERNGDRARQTVVFLVISGYLAVIEAEAQQVVAMDNLAAERDQESLVQKLVDAGKSPISDIYQQQANVARAELARVSARRALELARIDLVQTLQLDPAGDYLFDAPALPDSIDPGPAVELPPLLDQAFQGRADLVALETELRASEQGERAAAAGRWPTLSLSAGYGSSYSSGSSDASFSGQLDDRRSGNLSLGLSFPLFDRFAVSRSRERARIATENVRIALADRRQAVALEVRRAVLDGQSARESLNAALAGLRAATRALEATEQRYEAGASTLHEVTLSRTELVRSRSARVSAAYSLLWQKHVRDYYVGLLDPDTPLLPR